MSESQPAPLTGLALADALYDAGLAPADAERHERLGPLGLGDMHVYTYHRPATEFWRPWESLDAVAHLLELYGLETWCVQNKWRVVKPRQDWENVATFADLPAAIARLALRLHAAEQKEDTP